MLLDLGPLGAPGALGPCSLTLSLRIPDEVQIEQVSARVSVSPDSPFTPV